MDKLILKLCALRGYQAHDVAGLYVAHDGEIVGFYFTDVLTQDYLNTLDLERRSIVLCNKQKKLRVPIEILTNVEILVIDVVRRQLIENKFCPRFARLDGAELAQMERHRGQLPVLLATDPMAAIYGFRVGDLVKIYRKDESIYFREVVGN